MPPLRVGRELDRALAGSELRIGGAPRRREEIEEREEDDGDDPREEDAPGRFVVPKHVPVELLQERSEGGVIGSVGDPGVEKACDDSEE